MYAATGQGQTRMHWAEFQTVFFLNLSTEVMYLSTQRQTVSLTKAPKTKPGFLCCDTTMTSQEGNSQRILFLWWIHTEGCVEMLMTPKLRFYFELLGQKVTRHKSWPILNRPAWNKSFVRKFERPTCWWSQCAPFATADHLQINSLLHYSQLGTRLKWLDSKQIRWH